MFVHLLRNAYSLLLLLHLLRVHFPFPLRIFVLQLVNILSIILSVVRTFLCITSEVVKVPEPYIIAR